LTRLRRNAVLKGPSLEPPGQVEKLSLLGFLGLQARLDQVRLGMIMATSLRVMLGGEESAVEARRRHRAALLGSLAVLPLVVAAPRTQVSQPSSPMTRAEREEFLLKAAIVSEAQLALGVRRVTLADGQREHDASLETSTSDDPSRWGYRSNVAAYQLDKALDLDLVSPSVERTVNGRWESPGGGGLACRSRRSRPGGSARRL
jgi:hypothetical protein